MNGSTSGVAPSRWDWRGIALRRHTQLGPNGHPHSPLTGPPWCRQPGQLGRSVRDWLRAPTFGADPLSSQLGTRESAQQPAPNLRRVTGPGSFSTRRPAPQPTQSPVPSTVRPETVRSPMAVLRLFQQLWLHQASSPRTMAASTSHLNTTCSPGFRDVRLAGDEARISPISATST